MNVNLDLSKIQSYSTALSSKLCNSFFSDREVITGEQILSFTPVEQINLFIVKTLFERWKEELQKLRSPYFNYESVEVQDALNTLMNTLSKNISISKDFFTPLVQKSIYDSLVVSLSPIEYLQQEFTNKIGLSKNALLDKIKYHKIHESFFHEFQEKLKNITTEEISGAELRKLIPALSPLNTEEEQKAEEVLNAVALLLPFSVKDLLVPSASVTNGTISPANKPFGEEKKIKIEAPLKTIEKKSGGNILHQKLGEHQLTINDALKNTQETSIADRFSKSKIEDIKSSIPLNLKFLFINILFDGNSVEYTSALNDIELADNVERAREILHTKYAEKYAWSIHSEEAEEFFKIIERKFY